MSWVLDWWVWWGLSLVVTAALVGLGTRYWPWRDVVVLRIPRDRVFTRALEATRHVNEHNREASGENKRHQVYARLLKDFPHRSHRKIALAIEAALEG